MKQKLRRGPSSNVIHEHAIASTNITKNQIILLCNIINGDPNKDNNLIPFDIRHDRFPITFLLKKDEKYNRDQYDLVKGKLIKKLEDAIRLCAIETLQHLDKEMHPFISWNKQNSISNFNGSFIWTDGLMELKRRIVNNVSSLRIYGLSGLGKTRMVFESFRDFSKENRYWYCNCNESLTTLIKDKLRFIFESNNNYIVILDNCTKDDAKYYTKMRSSCKASNPMITIYNDPNEEEEDFTTYLSLEKEYDDVVEAIIGRYSKYIKLEEKVKIKEFAGGIPLMAELLVEGLRNGRTMGNLTDEELMSKLLGVSKDSDDRKVLQSLSLFDYLGYDGEYHKQIDFIATNKDITSISKDDSVIKNDFDELILRFLNRNIIEKIGRYIGIRPTPIALYLISEWLNSCTEDRMLRVIMAIQTSPFAGTLTESLSKRFKYLGYNEKAQIVLNQLLSSKSPFSNAEVLNTNLGSRLFRSFVEVNPTAVANCFWRVFGNMQTQELIKIVDGRRNIIWTLEKLAFYKETFEIGAKLLLKFALAENEKIGNNATGQFLNLFHIYLPGTEASLEDRVKIIRLGYTIEESRSLIIKAISHALKAREFSYFSGAERQGTRKRQHYHPQSYEEVFDYWENVLAILKEYSLLSYDNLNVVCEIVANSFSEILQFGGAQVILPSIEYYCEVKNNDWDEFRDMLNRYWISKTWSATPELYEKLVNISIRLTKTDFISRFKEIEKEQYESFDKHIKDTQERYRGFADEWVNHEGCDSLILNSLYQYSCQWTAPFGMRVAELLINSPEKAKQFVDNSIIHISKQPNKIYPIFNGFVKKCSDSIFEYVHEVCKEKAKSQLFILFAYRRYSLHDIDELFELVRDGHSDPSMFNLFCSYRIWQEGKKVIANFFSRLIDLGGESTYVALHLSHSFIYFQNTYFHTEVAQMISSRVIDGSIPFSFDREEFIETISVLLEKYDNPHLAKLVNENIIEKLRVHDIHVQFGYHIQKIYSILVEKYFKDIWPYLSQKLVEEDYSWVSFSLKNILGCMIGGLQGGILFKEDHMQELFEWCEKYPERAPYILAGYVPIYNIDGFSDYVIGLLDKFGDNNDVLRALGSNMGSFSCMGSLVPLYQKQYDAFMKISPHHNPNVERWIQINIEQLKRDIKNERDRDEEIRLL